MRKAGTLAIFLLLVLAAGAAAIYENWLRLPPNWLPWQPPVLDAEPSWLAHMQLNSLFADGDACRAVLGRSNLRFTVLADRHTDDFCGFTDVVRSEQSPIAFNYRVVATCGLTASLYWYQQRLNRIAQAQLGTSVVKIDQLGTYACRNINSEPMGRRSQHATANAIDIAAFHLADGRVISVAKDYGKPTAEGRFLDGAHDAACDFFNIVLGPRYNRLHATHFHLDMGPFRLCR
ncbi:MAG TPA: extensin family protein [Dongiaceae bacterium]